ncbi:hypothetical protein COU20_01365 [Candidatus Kaiserbacteria bacterium CG10_big_fil_rev_8_21_14_0_10_59_10]|uniref:Uncharacterized protein n=1 Tax=Candidatus Kaiserbacteria bacterium CG10_big_fil_rev_8_21_14_0_10_59_10 TaxID=1974612 RepID=A0A2H0U856_9BACT|nr:MAG: hypothetical protein COU20_01365 [Candidatus Kaiserbacteria bacterium CG10_big_fil_rev_8_21_14_0_10_59_10]
MIQKKLTRPSPVFRSSILFFFGGGILFQNCMGGNGEGEKARGAFASWLAGLDSNQGDDFQRVASYR